MAEHSYKAIRHLMIVWMLMSSLLLTIPAHSEVIQGFRDLKFGMTEKEVLALKDCSTSSECLYELAGKNRYLHPYYSRTTRGGSGVALSKITIDMGHFTDNWYGELQHRLLDQYQLTRDLRREDITAFQNGQLSELTAEYENGQVLLQVVRRNFGNLVLKVIYQNQDMAAETLKQHSLTTP